MSHGVSMVILTWNDFEHTALCLASIRREPNCEVLIVDNGSSESIASALRQLARENNATLVRSDVNLGYGRGMNLGIRHASKPVVILSNNDVEYDAGCIAALNAAALRDDIGLAVPVLVDSSRSYSGGETPLPSIKREVARCLFLERFVRPDPGWTWRQGAVVAIRRSILREIGGVSEKSFMYSEDLRMCAAVIQAGFRVCEVPGATARHIDDASAKRLWNDEQIASQQVEQLVVACAEILPGWRGRLYPWLFAAAAMERLVLRPTRRRWWIARSAARAWRTCLVR